MQAFVRTGRRLLPAILGLLVLSSAADAQKVRESRRHEDRNPGAANGGACEGMSGASFGLCNAFCEAQNCDEADTESNSCAALRRNYERVTGDDTFPCEEGAPTPTLTATGTATGTPVGSATATVTATDTPIPPTATATATETATSTPTDTPVDTATATATATDTPGTPVGTTTSVIP